jgi:hypothetical protein
MGREAPEPPGLSRSCAGNGATLELIDPFLQTRVG